MKPGNLRVFVRCYFQQNALILRDKEYIKFLVFLSHLEERFYFSGQKEELAMKTDEQLDKAIITMKDMLKDMSYGSITIVVQDGKVIHIEKNEKIRLK